VGDQETRFHGDLSDAVIHIPLLVFPPKTGVAAWPEQPSAPVSQADILPTILDLMGVQPAAALDGLSLRSPVPADRIRVVSPYMITLHNDPKAAIVLPDRQSHEVDFTQNSVQWSDGRTTPYSELPEVWRKRFDKRR
jgi:arylsulfatase A-like enzyme